jgi:serine/threonine-protein kinase
MSKLPDQLGKYKVKSVLGQGAMGVVYQAFDPDIERTVAIKVLHEHHCKGRSGKDLTERFRREAQAAARCLHPNIVTVFELGRHGEQDFIVMEFVQGEELKYFLSGAHQFALDEALLVATEILKALEAAHAHGVIHRDIKPANIILLDNGGVKVADFGVARLDQSDLTLAGNMVGTPNYMSPEGLRGEVVDQQADVYSAGMVLMEMLTGARLTPKDLYSTPIDRFIDNVYLTERGAVLSPELQQVIRTALSEDRAVRYPTVRDFHRALEVARQGGSLALDTTDRLAETVVGQKAVRTTDSANTRVEFSDQTLHELEVGLATYVGPIAGILVKKTSNGAATSEELLQALSIHIGDAKERDEFLRKAHTTISHDATGMRSSAGSSTSSGDSSFVQKASNASVSGFAESFSSAESEKLTELLAFYVGPMATHLLRRSLKKSASYSDLCLKLASSIPSDSERQDFLSKTQH